ncbi:hypothetical protein [Xylanimonas protaetiae]|uniref:Uncharacterized protein n=1 Tax=Xylanimonas protaetiae TaxID=2509457 RepID=A0A4V0YGF5_9MICO|nr:hypothetical protein [Xylanimonas protaetiae]QAY71031.1 hypothetical protein ET471_14150 [Xylanimonas protaetiae]
MAEDPGVDPTATATVRRPEPVGVPRATSGVRASEPPAGRWDPGARYRPSLLARIPGAPPHGDPLEAGPQRASLPGRLFRGPAVREAVFDRPVWTGHGRPASLRARNAAELSDAVERYRRGALSTTGLVRAVGHALAA